MDYLHLAIGDISDAPLNIMWRCCNSIYTMEIIIIIVIINVFIAVVITILSEVIVMI